jgi:protein-S-isoprenylcysteine O-methyltransferase Ste14
MLLSGLKRQWSVAVYTLAGALVLIATYLGRGRIDVAARPAALAGAVVVLVAAGLLAWSHLALGRALSLWTKPESDFLVQSGPYRFIRHPAYLGMLLAFVGIALAVRSWLGVVSVPVLMGPATWLRAKSEESELRKKFGQDWKQYVARTGFILPWLGRKRRTTGAR